MIIMWYRGKGFVIAFRTSDSNSSVDIQKKFSLNELYNIVIDSANKHNIYW